MNRFSRLDFLRLTVGVAATSVVHAAKGCVTAPGDTNSIGIYVGLDEEGYDHTFKRIHDLGFNHCELYTGMYGPEMIAPFKDAMKKYNMEVHALFTLGPGKTTWDFYEGQNDIGLISREYREGRLQALM